MSGLFNALHERREMMQEGVHDRREMRREGRQEHRQDRREEHEEHHDRHHRDHDRHDVDNRTVGSEYQNHGYQAPPGPPPGQLGGLDRGDFVSDNDFQRMMNSGSFNGGPQHQQYRDGESGGPGHNNYGGYDAPARPPQNQGYPSQQHQQGYGTEGAYAPSYNTAPDNRGQYAPPSGPPPQGQGYGAQPTHSQYNAPSGPPPGYGGPGSASGYGSGNAPAGGFTTSTSSSQLPHEERYGAGYNAPANDQGRARGEAASYYNESGNNDSSHGGSNDYKSHYDAHKKAYGEDSDSHGPMDADTIGAAAAMEAFKQTASQHQSQKPTSANDDDEEEESAPNRAPSGGGGMQDKIMSLAMSQAGKLFDKKNGGSSGDGSQGKAQAQQSAAATAMQLFTQYKTTGKLESTDMQKIMGIAMNML